MPVHFTNRFELQSPHVSLWARTASPADVSELTEWNEALRERTACQCQFERAGASERGALQPEVVASARRWPGVASSCLSGAQQPGVAAVARAAGGVGGLLMV